MEAFGTGEEDVMCVLQEWGQDSVCPCGKPQTEPSTLGIRVGEGNGWRPKVGSPFASVPSAHHILAPLQALASVVAQWE